MKSVSLDYWREYFRTANSDVFGIIDHAIMVAASDCPKEFRLRRDGIAERLFSYRLSRCSGCNRVESAHDDDDLDGDDDDDDIDIGVCEFEGGGTSKESKVNSSNNRDIVNDDQLVSNYSYGDAEALTDEIEQESMVVGEVLRIKDILLNGRDESDSVLFESLRRLQLMALTVDTLKATEIGKAVNGLRKHGSNEIRHLTRLLIDGWKVLVDEWYSTTKTIRGTPESVNPSVVDEEEGLPSPPLDEAFFFASQTTGIELSQFFDGMDDDGNPRNHGEFIKNRDNGRKTSPEHQNITKRKQQTPSEANVVAKDSKSQQIRRQEATVRPDKPSTNSSAPGRLQKQSSEQKLQRKPDKLISQRKPPSGQQDKFKCSDDVAVQKKLEASKRKLHERYQQVENAKRQRTIQVMELQDLPKQGLIQKNTHMRPGSHNRHRAQGRR
ncbi:probable mediator of RNA polymerase II transcription subunit 26b isoform X2 [Mercurialis annua]|uniref:probable mediator of RNA polymerase II transcription subunit 26b isoform X2 n=1 Tax=Mercurialis annua TaxID=3986 RepID=UPI00215F2495|nr:probable mediator of RNA polymerase II transcription subunit 26b isoform X2 [Mercurialis annua]